jgi:hypothetical protein
MWPAWLSDELEEAVNQQPDDLTVRRVEVLTLIQPSARRRAYRLQRADQTIGGLEFPSGRRSLALAEGRGTGALALTASAGGVEVRGGPDAAATIATVERAPASAAAIRTVQGPTLWWRRAGRWHQWAIQDGEQTMLRFVAAHGLLRSSVRITAHQDLPEPTAVLLCLVGGFLALQSLQTEIDEAAAVGGIVAAGAG